MRFVTALFLWVLTTVLLAAALPAAWAQTNLVDIDGYTAFTRHAAADPALQRAVASELSTQIVDLGYGGNETVLRGVTSAYTASSAFPGQFALANRFAHQWLFTNAISSGEDPRGRWVIDLAPMLSDSSFATTLNQFGISVPSTLPVPLTENASDAIRPGQLRPVAVWGPWVSVGATILAGVFALLTLAAARSRGKALAALGISALLVGAAGWAGLEVGRRYVGKVLDGTGTGDDVRQIVEALLRHATDNMHQWLNLTLAAGGVLVALGVIVATLGGVRERRVQRPG